MNEVKSPKKPLLYYYAIVMTCIILFNLLAMPWLADMQIKEVDYGTFMSMTEEQNIGQVDIQANQILFTDKEKTQVYKTGVMDDPNRTERLYAAGATLCSRSNFFQ